jgi:diguanylate cyclase (GGDEF)-like protein
MRNRVTTKVVLATAIAMSIVTFALLVIVWQWQSDNSDRVETEYSRQVINTVSHADPNLLYRGPNGMPQIVLNALPSRVRLRSLALSDPSGATKLEWSGDDVDDDSYSSEDSLVANAANSLSPLPNYLTVDSNVRLHGGPGLPTLTKMVAVLDLRDQKAEDAYQMAEVLQIFFPIALICIFFVYFGVRYWVQRPAEAIIRVAHRIAAGDQDLRLAVRTQDEFGLIMQAFNDLTDALLTTQHQADTDGLTQVFNHRYLQEKVGEALQIATQSGRCMAIVLIDLNKFKLLNDTYGHLVGDRFLQQTASVLRRAVHLDGVVGRYGGDEFLIVLPHATRERADQSAQRIRTLMEAEQFRPSPNTDPLPFSFSMGMAVFPENGSTSQELIAYADAALYTEKQGGYNLVELTREIESEYELQCPERASKAQSGGLFGTLLSLVVGVDNKDSYTKRHSIHVADWAVRLGQAVGLPPQTLRALLVAGLLHDVGKIGVPDFILRKPGPLSGQEQEIMAGHVILSERLIQEVPYQEEVVEAVSCHHERWDGQGYPHGKKGEEMPITGRIMAIVDAYSAMCLDRPYRLAMPIEEICAELERGSGTQFDPDLAVKLIALIESHEPDQLRPESDKPSEKTLEIARSARRNTSKLADAA